MSVRCRKIAFLRHVDYNEEKALMLVKAKAILSVIIGFFFGLVTYCVLLVFEIDHALLFSVFGATVFYLLLLLFLLLHGAITNKIYTKLEKEISSPVFYKTNGNFTLENGIVKNGNIYFCEAGIACMCVDGKPYLFAEILLQDIDRYEFDDIHLHIVTKDGRRFVITLPDTKTVIKALQEHKWIVL